MSKNQYTKIARDEFETFLAEEIGEFETVDLRGVNENVYDLPTSYDYLHVRVWSSIEGDAGRESGADAIRVTVWDDHAGHSVDGATRTHRIQTWRQNLAPKVADLLARVEAGEFESEDPVANLREFEFDTAEGEAGTVYVADVFENSYHDLRVALDGDTYDAKETIKGVGWDETHHKFDGDRKTWNVDAEAFAAVAAALREDGFAVAETPLDADADDAAEESDAWDADEAEAVAQAVSEGDHVTVEYEKKNGDGTKTVGGTVTWAETDPGRTTFERDGDGHTMYLNAEGLFTARSAYPFVGTPVRVTNDR